MKTTRNNSLFTAHLRHLGVAIALAIMSYSSVASAAGFFIPPHGVRAMGRGGAAVVGVNDLNALWYNPALIAGIDGGLFMLDVNVVNQNVRFHRQSRTYDNGQVLKFDPVSNAAPPMPIPQMGVAIPLGNGDFVLAAGLFGPNGAASVYPEKGPQRYTLIDTMGSFVVTSELALGWKVSDWLWLGAGFQNLMMNYKMLASPSGYPGFVGDAEDPETDILLEVMMESYFNPSANFGFKILTSVGLELGGSVQLPVRLEDKAGKVRHRMPTHPMFANAKMEGETVSAGFNLPLTLRGGLRYVATNWDVELDVVWEQWSTMEKIVMSPNNMKVTGVPGVGEMALGDFVVPRNYEDTLSVRLGGEIAVLPEQLSVRAGAMWEQSAVPSSTLSVMQADAEKMALSMGLSYEFTPSFGVDLGYTHVFYRDTMVTDSVMKQLNPANESGTVVVGNGSYEISADHFGVGLRAGW
ncbi:MAG TPA: hypothetical protein EYN06_09295 [Myxococcales bacterium]|nr:hypothetical protein [Myxococcales bacterium]HIN86663.1 hypothetical protein [Myxococcales bacterium]